MGGSVTNGATPSTLITNIWCSKQLIGTVNCWESHKQINNIEFQTKLPQLVWKTCITKIPKLFQKYKITTYNKRKLYYFQARATAM